MIGTWRQHFRHHARFYLAALTGIGVWFVTPLPWPIRALIAGDAFFVVYLTLMAILAASTNPDGLRRRAGEEDEGILLIVLLALAAIAFSLSAIFLLLNQSTTNPYELGLGIASVPLGWLMLHTIAAFHYAHRYYASADEGADKSDAGGLDFPSCSEPGPWDFLYFSFVIGMTAQVSDVVIHQTDLRRRALAHSIVSFFYNTVLLALAINVAVTLGRGAQ